MQKGTDGFVCYRKMLTAVSEFQLHGRKPTRPVYFKRRHTADGSDHLRLPQDISTPPHTLIITNNRPRVAAPFMPYNGRIVLLIA